MENYILTQTSEQVQSELDLVDSLAETFSSGTSYIEGDIVLYNGKLYSCISTTSIIGNWDSTKWQEASFSAVKRWITKRLSEVTSVAEFSTSATYAKGAKVCYNGYIYVAKSSVSAGNFNPNNWDRAAIYTAGTGISIDINKNINAVGLSYTTTAPSANNEAGDVKIVILNQEPSTKYSGYLYFIKNS